MKQTSILSDSRAIPAEGAAAEAPVAVESSGLAAVELAPHAGDRIVELETGKLVRQLFSPGENKSVLFCGIDAATDASRAAARVARRLAAEKAQPVCLLILSGSGPADMASQLASAGELRPQAYRFLLPVSGPESTQENLRGELEFLLARFPYAVIAAPDLASSEVSVQLAQLVSGIVLVIDAGKTRRAAALKAKESIAALNGKLLGTVLENRTFPIPETIYNRL